MPNFSQQLKKLNPQRHGSYILPDGSGSMEPSFRKSPHYKSDPSHPNRGHRLTQLGEYIKLTDAVNRAIDSPLMSALIEEDRIRSAIDEDVYVMPDSFLYQDDDDIYMDMSGGMANCESLVTDQKEIVPVDQTARASFSEAAPPVPSYDRLKELVNKE